MGNYYKAASDNRWAITYNGRFSCMGKYINLYVRHKEKTKAQASTRGKLVHFLLYTVS